MSAEVWPTGWAAGCFECGWSFEASTEEVADKAADLHDAARHNDEVES